MLRLNAMSSTAIKLILAILSVAVISNLAFLNYKTLSKSKTSESTDGATPPANLPVSTETITQECGADCLKMVEASISAVNKRIDQVQASIPKSTTQTTTSQTSTQLKYVYLNFGVNGSTQSTSWTDLTGSDFIFDSANYSNAKGFYFEGNLKSDASDRDTFARIYDVTHSVGVQGSDIGYRGLTSSFQDSGSLTFLAGKLTLRVQIHSLNGNLATIDNPRIRVVY